MNLVVNDLKTLADDFVLPVSFSGLISEKEIRHLFWSTGKINDSLIFKPLVFREAFKTQHLI